MRSSEMKYLPLILMGCVKTVYVERLIEVNNVNDITIGIELQAWCEELRRRQDDRWELNSVEIYNERESLLFEVNRYFVWSSYPKELDDCIAELNC